MDNNYNWKRRLGRLAADEAGVTSLEYALGGALIAVVCIAAIGAVGSNVTVLFTAVCNEVTTAISGAPTC